MSKIKTFKEFIDKESKPQSKQKLILEELQDPEIIKFLQTQQKKLKGSALRKKKE